MFHVGQKVVCVNASCPQRRAGDPRWPLKKNEIYTIIGFAKHPWYEEETLLLEEVNETGFDGSGYLAFRFRPVVEKKTSIAVFQEILDRVNGRVGVGEKV